MSKITDLTILQEFTSKDYTNKTIVYGLYWAKFNDSYKLFSRNGNVIKVLSHNYGNDSLDIIRDDVKEKLLQAIDNIKS
jgi:hypothetical protein